MNIALEITKVGDGLGIILPAEALADFGLEEGSQLCLTKASGGILLSRADEVAAQMKFVDEVFERYPETLRELAK